jgi:hypothetical protein
MSVAVVTQIVTHPQRSLGRACLWGVLP